MIKRNVKTITTLALAAVLSTGMVTVTHADGVSNSINIAKSQQALKSSSNVLLPKDKKEAVTLWAEALKQRNGAFRYAILNNDLKKQEYKKYSEMNWVIGGSSPWVLSYEIKEKNKKDDKTFEYEIKYTMTDSSKTSYSAYEDVTVTQLGQNWLVTKHDAYDYLPDNIIENNGSKFSKVQTKELESAVLPRDKESTVNLWAEALKERNGAFRYAVLNNDLKKQEYEKYNKMNWVIGGSSPKVVSYKINETNKIDDKNYEYKISYTLTDSTKALYHAEENIVVTELGQNCFVTKHDNYDYLPNITE